MKGGGQITEIEGQKGEAAIARLRTAQSEPEFLEALQDFRELVGELLEEQTRQSKGDFGNYIEKSKREKKDEAKRSKTGSLSAEEEKELKMLEAQEAVNERR